MAWGLPGLLLIAALDSAGVPIPAAVDALLLLFASKNPGSAYWGAAIALIGSVIGSMVLFFIARKGGEKYLEKHTLGARGQKLKTWFQHYGLLTVFISAISPLPLPMKLFVLSAGALGIPPLHFLLTIVAARTPRYFALAYLGTQMGTQAGAYLKTHAWTIGGILLLLFAVLFGAIKIMDWRRAKSTGQGRS